MNRERRVLVCVALGLAMAVLAAGVNRLIDGEPTGGWFMYEPGTDPGFGWSTSSGEVMRRAAVWLAAVGLWAAVSWRLFRDRTD